MTSEARDQNLQDVVSELAYRGGLPGKNDSGVLATAPGKSSIAVLSPECDTNGKSHPGPITLEMLTRRLGWSIFGGDERLPNRSQP